MISCTLLAERLNRWSAPHTRDQTKGAVRNIYHRVTFKEFHHSKRWPISHTEAKYEMPRCTLELSVKPFRQNTSNRQFNNLDLESLTYKLQLTEHKSEPAGC
jgi:hypothetical protein